MCCVFATLLLAIAIAAIILAVLSKSPARITTTTTTTTTTSRPSGSLSKYAIVTASLFSPSAGTPAAQADGLLDRNPNGVAFAAYGPPAYVQLELPDVYNITSISLLIDQSQNGTTHHQLLVGPSENSTQMVNNLIGVTYRNQWINLTYNPPLNNVRFLHLKTIICPSWVSWRKFLVHGV